MDKKERILDDFDHGDIKKYEKSHNFVKSYDLSFSREQVIDGELSLKLAYDFGGWIHGNGAMPIQFKDDLITNKRPLKFGLWVYGDKKSPWLRAVFIDGLGEKKTVNLTTENVNWYGWKYVDAEISKSWKLPIRLANIYAVETNKEHQGNSSYRGELYFDQLRFVYVDDEDLAGPEFRSVTPEKDVIYCNTFTFKTTVVDEQSGVDPTSIIMKVNNEKVDCEYCEVTQQITYGFDKVEQGIYKIEVDAMDNAGNKSVPNIEKLLTVDLTPDIEEPIISNITPTETAIEYTNTPRITFNIVDEKSGINAADIIVDINGQKQEVTYDADTGWAYAVSEDELNDGLHELVISASDRSGNMMKPIKKYFTVEALQSPKINNFSVSILPDTHSFEYGRLGIAQAINQETEFIIHMGDLVDQATETEYKQTQENLALLKDKPMLTIPGNHESFQGNLDNYMTLFGSPTYHVTYGQTLFIFLNTAYDQSIRLSDSTQFIYLEKTLKANTLKTVVIITHVPTKDHFGTAHEMDRSDATKLEEILSNYKKANSDIHITVLFGHLHVLKQWEISGVDYIITGNCAAKGYVANELGNVLGNGILHVTPDGMTYEFMPYVKDLFIYLNNRQIQQLVVQKGTQYNLQVFGQINEVHTHYTINLTDFKHVKKEWTSENERVISIDHEGVIKALQQGKSLIYVSVCGKSVGIEIKVIESNNLSCNKIGVIT